jgi:hypothetical protein
MTSQVRFLHAVLRMPPHRPPRIALLSGISRLQGHLDNDWSPLASALSPQDPDILPSSTVAHCCSTYHLCFGGIDLGDLLCSLSPRSKHGVKKDLMPTVRLAACGATQNDLFDRRPVHHASSLYIDTAPAVSVSSHLACMANGSLLRCFESPLIITRWRVGSAAIGGTIDRFYPPWGDHRPFCCWCQHSSSPLKTADNEAHALLGCTNPISVAIRLKHQPKLYSQMRLLCPES